MATVSNSSNYDECMKKRKQSQDDSNKNPPAKKLAGDDRERKPETNNAVASQPSSPPHQDEATEPRTEEMHVDPPPPEKTGEDQESSSVPIQQMHKLVGHTHKQKALELLEEHADFTDVLLTGYDAMSALDFNNKYEFPGIGVPSTHDDDGTFNAELINEISDKSKDCLLLMTKLKILVFMGPQEKFVEAEQMIAEMSKQVTAKIEEIEKWFAEHPLFMQKVYAHLNEEAAAFITQYEDIEKDLKSCDHLLYKSIIAFIYRLFARNAYPYPNFLKLVADTAARGQQHDPVVEQIYEKVNTIQQIVDALAGTEDRTPLGVLLWNCIYIDYDEAKIMYRDAFPKVSDDLLLQLASTNNPSAGPFYWQQADDSSSECGDSATTCKPTGATVDPVAMLTAVMQQATQNQAPAKKTCDDEEKYDDEEALALAEKILGDTAKLAKDQSGGIEDIDTKHGCVMREFVVGELEKHPKINNKAEALKLLMPLLHSRCDAESLCDVTADSELTKLEAKKNALQSALDKLDAKVKIEQMTYDTMSKVPELAQKAKLAQGSLDRAKTARDKKQFELDDVKKEINVLAGTTNNSVTETPFKAAVAHYVAIGIRTPGVGDVRAKQNALTPWIQRYLALKKYVALLEKAEPSLQYVIGHVKTLGGALNVDPFAHFTVQQHEARIREIDYQLQQARSGLLRRMKRDQECPLASDHTDAEEVAMEEEVEEA